MIIDSLSSWWLFGAVDIPSTESVEIKDVKALICVAPRPNKVRAFHNGDLTRIGDKVCEGCRRWER